MSLLNKFFYKLLNGRQQFHLIILFVMMVIRVILETLSIGVIIPAVTVLLKPEILKNALSSYTYLSWINNLDHLQLIYYGTALLLAIFSIKAIYISALSYYQTKYIFNIQKSIASQLYNLYINQPYKFYLTINSADLIRNITAEVKLLTEALLALFQVLTESFILVCMILLLLFIEPFGAFISFAIVGTIGVISMYFLYHPLRKWGEERQFHEGQRIQNLQQSFGGIRDIKLLGKEKYFFNKFYLHESRLATLNARRTFIAYQPAIIIEWLAVLGICILITTSISTNENTVNVLITLSIFAGAAFRLLPSISRLLNGSSNVIFALPVIDIISKELSLPKTHSSSKTPPPDHTTSMALENELELNNISFKFSPDKNYVLEDISFKIKSGTSVGIIGESGAGKSTLLYTILGLLTPDEGEIKVDGINIANNLRQWQKQIGYVPQSIYLSDESLRNNIAFGIPEDEIDENAVISALEAAQLMDFVKTLPDGLDTTVGENGARLSGGQKQRIGIARALYIQPSVIALDEATSALDTENEKGVMAAVNSLRGKKTILIVAHRLTTVEKCDYLYRLEGGKIVQQGTPEQILK